MLAMNNEGFPLFKRTCSAQIVSMACFPGLGPSVRHAPVCSSIGLVLNVSVIYLPLGDRQPPEGTLCYPSPGAGAAPGRRITQGYLHKLFVSQWEVNNGDI